MAGTLSATPEAGSAALLSYEGFDYPAGDSLIGKNGGFGFSQAWQLNSSQGLQTNQAYSLSYTDALGKRLVTRGGSLFLQGSLTDGVNASQPNRLLSYSRGTNSGGSDGVTTWVSFLAYRRGPTTNSTTVPDNPYPRSANVSLYNSVPSNAEKLAMGNTSDTPSNTVALLPVGSIANIRTTSVSYSQTNFIVVRIDHNVGQNDDAYMFVNPQLGSEPSLNSANTNSLGEFDFTFNRVRPYAGSQRNSTQQPYAELVIDEIRIGETFADVAPYLASIAVSHVGNKVVLSWPGTSSLQSATNVAGPYGTVSGASNPYTNDLSEPQRFFRLLQ